MEFVEKIVRFLADAVTVNMGRYLLIFFLSAFAFVVVILLNMACRAVLDPIATKIFRLKENSRLLPWTATVGSVIAAYFLLAKVVYVYLPVLNPLTHTQWRPF